MYTNKLEAERYPMSNFNIFKLALQKGVDNTASLFNRGFWQDFLHI